LISKESVLVREVLQWLSLVTFYLTTYFENP